MMDAADQKPDEKLSEEETALSPIEESVQPSSDELHVKLRKDFTFFFEGVHKFKTGHVFSSFEYDLDKLAAQGAELDLLDGHDGDVVADYAELREHLK